MSHNVVPLVPRNAPLRDSRMLLEIVYGAGALTIPATDRQIKLSTLGLRLINFVTVRAVLEDGSLTQPLSTREALAVIDGGPWVVAKPTPGAIAPTS